MYKGFNRRSSKPSLFLKGSARVVEPPRLEYKGFKYKYSIKGDIARLWYIRSLYSTNYIDGVTTRFNSNDGVVITKKQNIKSKFVKGPISISIRIKKLHTLFKVIV